MPKIELSRGAFFARLGKTCTNNELEKLLTVAKAELDEMLDNTIKIELNDTNRPDLWSLAGLTRLLRIYEGADIPEYPFFSRINDTKNSANRRIQVDKSIQNIRPYIVGFAAGGRTITEDILNEIIQTQEKLCWNFGQKRRAIAMGIYRNDRIQYPVHYRGADPDTTTFVPLGFDHPMSLRKINEDHPKGQEYGHIVAEHPLFPLLCDDKGAVLSYPPVINSADIGAVEVGHNEIFVELTGTNLQNLILTASIVACDLADEGFTILPVKAEYPFTTEFGREITIPYYFQEAQKVESHSINSLLGLRLNSTEIRQSLERMGNKIVKSRNSLLLVPPEYRNDFLHSVDVAEDVMIGRGMDSFSPELPNDFTIGRLTPIEEFMRSVRNVMVGLGFQEMIFNYLGSARDYIYRMHPNFSLIASESDDKTSSHDSLCDILLPADIVQILNPMSENHEFLRNSILPALLNAESVSGNAAYPHAIFEVGKTVSPDAENAYGSRSKNALGFVVADQNAGFNHISSQVATLFYYIGKTYTIEESNDLRFINGRVAALMVHGRQVGVFGELHPGILVNWSISMPASACEIDLDMLLGG